MTNNMIQKSKELMKVIVLIAAAAVAITTALTYFAKTKTGQALDQRMWLNTSQDIVRHKESDVRWKVQRIGSQPRDNKPTLAEKEIIAKAKEDLTEAKARHNERVKKYEEQYKENF